MAEPQTGGQPSTPPSPAPVGRKIVVIDEIHTPDSSRFWQASTYDERMAAGKDPEAFDKDVVRRHFLSVGYKGEGEGPAIPDDVRVEAARKYIGAYEQITGEAFLIVAGALSVIAGVLVLVHPIAGVLGIAVLIGVYAVLYGVMLIVLAFRLRGLPGPVAAEQAPEAG